jgi:hypothetical protein
MNCLDLIKEGLDYQWLDSAVDIDLSNRSFMVNTCKTLCYVIQCCKACSYSSCKTMGSMSPETESHSSRSSSPDDVSPTLHSDRCYAGVASHPGESPSPTGSSTQYSTANAGTCNYGFYLNVQFMVFLYDIFNDDVRSSGCIVSDGRVINE